MIGAVRGNTESLKDNRHALQKFSTSIASVPTKRKQRQHHLRTWRIFSQECNLGCMLEIPHVECHNNARSRQQHQVPNPNPWTSVQQSNSIPGRAGLVPHNRVLVHALHHSLALVLSGLQAGESMAGSLNSFTHLAVQNSCSSWKVAQGQAMHALHECNYSAMLSFMNYCHHYSYEAITVVIWITDSQCLPYITVSIPSCILIHVFIQAEDAAYIHGAHISVSFL
eukprot:1157347-Pelagomonas_calceolata.AAC.9